MVNQVGEESSEHYEESVLAYTGFHGFISRNRKCSFPGTVEHVFSYIVGKGYLILLACRY